MPRVLNDEEKRVVLVVSNMINIRDARMEWEEKRFVMANNMRDIRAKRLARASNFAAHEHELRVSKGNLVGPLSTGRSKP